MKIILNILVSLSVCIYAFYFAVEARGRGGVVAVAAIILAILLAIIPWWLDWALKRKRNKVDSQKIYEFLSSSAEYTFRSTAAIAAGVGLTEARVEQLCSAHPQIRRNEGQKQSWRIAGHGEIVVC